MTHGYKTLVFLSFLRTPSFHSYFRYLLKTPAEKYVLTELVHYNSILLGSFVVLYHFFPISESSVLNSFHIIYIYIKFGMKFATLRRKHRISYKISKSGEYCFTQTVHFFL